MGTPQELRDEADAADEMSKVVSYAPDKAWLQEKAAALRQQADREERRGDRRPPDR